jgi:hypothetical protein
MTNSRPVHRQHERSNLRGALITLIIEATIVVTLVAVGFGISFLLLWITG